MERKAMDGKGADWCGLDGKGWDRFFTTTRRIDMVEERGEGRAERYPLDYDRLVKGDIVTAEQLANILGEEPGTMEYHRKLFYFSQKAEHEFWGRGREYTLAIRGEDLHILADVE